MSVDLYLFQTDEYFTEFVGMPTSIRICVVGQLQNDMSVMSAVKVLLLNT